MKQSTFTVGMRDEQDNYKEVVVTVPGNAHLYDNNSDADAQAFDAFCVAAESAAESQNEGFTATSCRLQAPDTNDQNRTADGRIATVKEAQRADCLEMIARYRTEALGFIRAGNRAAAQHLVNKSAQLRAAFFVDYAEAA